MKCLDLPTTSNKDLNMVKVALLATSQITIRIRNDANTLRYLVMMRVEMTRSITTYFERIQDMIKEQCQVLNGSRSEVSNSSGNNNRLNKKVSSINLVLRKSSRRKYLMNSTSTLTSRDRQKKQVLLEMTQRVQTIRVRLRLALKKLSWAPK